MVDNNVQNIKFLRNGNVFTPSIDPVKTAREVALSAMNGQLNSLADGTAILGRYKETDGVVKTLVGFAYISDNAKTLTVFDVDGAGADVDKKILSAIQALDADVTSSGGKNVQVKVTEEDGKITAVNITTDNTVNSGDVNTAIKNAINELDGSVVAESGFYVKSVTEADGKINGTTEALPTVPSISNEGQAITAVSQSKGAVSASYGDIAAAHVTVDDSGKKFTASTVEAVLAEIADEIDAMDLDVVSGDGEVITAVSEKDGKVSASKTAIKDVKLTGYAKNTTATGPISGNDDIEDALSKLENTIVSNAITNADGSITVTPSDDSTTDVKVHIKSGEKVIKLDGNGGGIYTDIKIASATPSSTTVKEEYNLLDSDGNALGASIKIYKDSHIVSITYITDSGDTHYQNLEYKYLDADGAEKVEYVDISSLVLEAEFASGVTATNHVVHGVVDSTSEKDSSNNSFLTVGANGFKVDGIKGEIATKINTLNATVSGESADKKVNVKVTETNGVITAVDVIGTDIASAQGLADEITARKAVDGVDGDDYTADTNAHYISGASTLYGADQALDAALNTVDNAMLTSVAAGNGVEVTAKKNKSQTISAKVNGDGGILNDSAGLHLGTIDCGTY